MARKISHWHLPLYLTLPCVAAVALCWWLLPGAEQRLMLGHGTTMASAGLAILFLHLASNHFRRMDEQRPWRVFVISAICILLANLGGLISFLCWRADFPAGWQAVLFLAAYLFLCFGLLRHAGRLPSGALTITVLLFDIALTLYLLLLIAIYFNLPALLARGRTPIEVYAHWGYAATIAAVLLCGVAALSAVVSKGLAGPRGLLLLVAGILLAADTTWAYITVCQATMVALPPLLLRLVGYLLLGAAAQWHSERASEPAHSRLLADASPFPQGMLVPALLTIVVAVLALGGGPRQVSPLPAPLVLHGLAILLLLVVVRLGLAAVHSRHSFETLQRQLVESERMVMTDALTGLANKRHCLQRLEDEISRAVRYARPLSLLFCDIDFFKLVNDVHGHHAGDQVLCLVAACLRDRIRTTDLIARLGGEEFIIILPETAMEPAHILAERLRQAVERLYIPLPDGKTVQVTISIGVSACPETSKTVESLLDNADEAMNYAKEHGRNRVATAKAIRHLFLVS